MRGDHTVNVFANIMIFFVHNFESSKKFERIFNIVDYLQKGNKLKIVFERIFCAFLAYF